jgi:hypothetical protein
MASFSKKLADVRERIAESEARIEEQEDRIRTGGCETVADAAFLLYSAATTVRELRAYEARLQKLANARRD